METPQHDAGRENKGNTPDYIRACEYQTYDFGVDGGPPLQQQPHTIHVPSETGSMQWRTANPLHNAVIHTSPCHGRPQVMEG